MDLASQHLLVGVLAVLVVATTIERVLVWRAGDPCGATLQNLGDRIYSWWIMVGVLRSPFCSATSASWPCSPPHLF